jgi:hypothetical protein
MTEVFRHHGTVRREDGKGYRRHAFVVPGAGALEIEFSYDRGGERPHSLLTLSLFDPLGFRGAGHRFAPQQTIRLEPHQATPGFLAGPIPAGEWTVEVDIHCVIPRPDGELNRYDLVVSTGAARAAAPVVPAASAASDDAPIARGRRWYRGELHLHSRHSDGQWTPAEIAERARPRGLDFMVLSDHNTTSSHQEFRSLVDPRTLVIPGTELTTYHGHCLAIGVERWIDWRTGLDGRSINDVARDVRAAGGLVFIAHPDAMPDDVCTGCRWTHDDFDPALADGVEIWGGLWDGPEEENEGCVALWHRWLGLGHRLTATAATDAHKPKDWEGAVPLTYVLADELSRAAILEGLRAGRTYVSSGPELYLEQTAGGVEARCAGAPDANLRIVADGARLASVRVRGEGRLSASLAARWANAELWNAEGTLMLAATSPVYARDLDSSSAPRA